MNRIDQSRQTAWVTELCETYAATISADREILSDDAALETGMLLSSKNDLAANRIS